MKSGLPPRDHLYNGTICRSFAAQRIGANGQFYQPDVPHTGGDVLVAPPAILPRVSPERPGIWRRTMHDTVFLNSRGDVTSYAPNGFRRFQARIQSPQLCMGASAAPVCPDRSLHLAGIREIGWNCRVAGAQVRVEARWSSLPDGGHPTLLPLLLRRGGHAEALLAAGAEGATLLTPMGARLTEFPIPSPPVASFEAIDFDGERSAGRLACFIGTPCCAADSGDARRAALPRARAV